MSLIKEIHNQPEWVRTLLFALTCVTVVGFAGYMVLTTFERGVILAINPEDGSERIAELEKGRPHPMAAVRRGVSSAMANIGGVLGFDSSAGFDIDPKKDDNQDRVYLLPISE